MTVLSNQQVSKYWAIVPAAGVGARMNSDTPKQYLPLAGKTVIEHTLNRLAEVTQLSGIVVALSVQDDYWKDINLPEHMQVSVVKGGSERYLSVFNSLQHLLGIADPQDWVLVHDAARPCVRSSDIQNLIERVCKHKVGGLLGLPVRDTMKRVDAEQQVNNTVDRDSLWHALTPQMFRLGDLMTALQSVIENDSAVTDDASAIELSGSSPLMVEGHADNIKITRPQDLQLADLFLQQQLAE